MLIAVAKVRSAHGVKGFIKVSALSGSSETIRAQKELLIGKDQGSVQAYKLDSIRPTTGDNVLLKLEGVDSMDDAELLAGMTAYVPEEALPSLPELTYYSYQLEGCSVLFEDGSPLGVLKRVENFPANDVMVVVTEAGKEALVPATRDIVKSVDLDGRRIVIENRKGLV
ncbi:MAG TPA: ribosome maturation factor RimM [Bacillota bacterium]|nr:ribosome maturation factor RimM [Bacillota bacterium]HOG53581.1 ribosome maturation factor RimM [Bacillota bacterium]